MNLFPSFAPEKAQGVEKCVVVLKFFQCLSSLCSFARDALSLFCAQFEEVYIYRERADASIANNSARELFRERKREVSLR